jgi:MFS family permease
MENSLAYPKSRWLFLATVFVGYVAVGMFIIMFAPVVGIIAEEFGVTPGQMSFYGIALYTIVNAISCIASGVLFDRFGIKSVLAIGTIIVVVVALLLPLLTQSLTGIIVLRVLLGIGCGPLTGCTASVAATWFPPKERGLCNGITGTGMTVGITIALMVIGARLTMLQGDWRAAIQPLVIIPIISMVMVVILFIVTKNVVPPTQSQIASKAEITGVFASVVKAPTFALVIICMICYAWAMNAFTDLSPGYIAIDKPMGLGFGAEAASFMAMLISIGNICGALCAGILIDKVFKGKVTSILVTAFIVQFLSVLLVRSSVVAEIRPLFLVLLFLIGFTIGMIVPSIAVLLAVRMPFTVIGKVFSIGLGVALLVGAGGVALCSLLLHTTETYQAPLLVIAIIALIGVFPALFFERTKVTK